MRAMTNAAQGFRKVSPDRWEFAHTDFLAGQRHLLGNICRRRGAAGGSSTASGPPSSGVTKAGGSGSSGGGRESELERLRRDREALARELARLRRGQEEARAQLLDMERRVRGSERRQEQCTAFLSRAVGNPGFLDALLARRGHAAGGAAPVEAGRKRRLLDAAAAAATPDVADTLAFEELALAAGAEFETAPASQSPRSTATATDMIWYELLGEEQVEIDAEVEQLVAAAAAAKAAEPWEEMGDEEVEELVQKIDGCLGSPSP
jgi:heat shock transcription factor